MGAPVLIGAGVGALASLATGRDPLQGAALGGLTAGAFGGSTGFGSGFTEGGLFNLGSSVTPTAVEPAIGSAVTPEFTPSLLTNSANPMAGPMTAIVPDPYTGATSMMQSQNLGAAQSFGLDSGAGAVATGGGYTPYSQELLRPDFTPIANAQISGGGYEPSSSLLDTAYEGIAGMSPMEQVQLGQMGLDAATPEERAAVEAQMANISPPKGVAPARGTMIAINTPKKTFKPRFA